MEDVAIYVSQLLNVIFAAGMLLIIKGRLKRGTVGELRGKRIYSAAVMGGGVVSGTFVYQGLVWAFESAGVPQSTGQGEVLIAAFLFNVGWAVFFMLVGRVVLSWRRMEW